MSFVHRIKTRLFPKNIRWKRFLVELAGLLVVIYGIKAWQSRDMLSISGETPAPGFTLSGLDGQTYDLSDYLGKKTLLYFFAPWCQVCKLSISNLNDLYADMNREKKAILIIALDFQSEQEIKDFVEEFALTPPVLFGNSAVSESYAIGGYPSYYILDEQHRLTSRSIGYSSEIGLRWSLR